MNIYTKTSFKNTEIGEIPQDWKVSKLSDLIEIIGGGTPKTTEAEYWDGDIPWLSVVDFNDENRFVYKTEKTISEKGLKNSSTKILKKGQIIISARGTVGALAQLGLDMAFNQSCYGISGKNISNDFLYYCIKNSINRIKQNVHGAVFDTITKETFDSLLVGYPDNEKEQNQIVSILSSLDDKIELNQKTIKTLEEIGQTLFKRWFIDFEFPNEKGEPYKSSGGEMVDSELGEISKGWSVSNLESIGTFLNGLALQKYPKTGEDFLYAIKIKELNNGITESTDKVSTDVPKEYVVDCGDLLFSWSGSLDVVIWGEGKGALNQHLFKVTSDLYPKWFVYSWIKQHISFFQMIAASKATTMGHIQRKHLTEALVTIPPKAILNKADELLQPILDLLIEKKKEIQTLTKTKNYLLPKLLSGKIRV